MKGAGKRVLDAIDYLPTFLPPLLLLAVAIGIPQRMTFS